MKLLHVINSANPVTGGPIEGIRQLASAFATADTRITLVCGDAPDEPWLAELPFEVVALGPSVGHYGYIPDLYDWLVNHADNFDALIVNGIWQYHGIAVRAAAHRLGRSYFVFPHGMLDPWFRKRFPLKHLKKLAYWRVAEYPVLRDAQAVMFTCDEEKRLAPLSFRPNDWTARVIHYGTGGSTGDPSRERRAFLEHFPHLADTRNILFLGRITEKKGLDMLISAFAQVAGRDERLRLVLAGPVDDTMKGPLELQVHALGLDRLVAWTGMLKGDQKWGAFRAADAFVLPSHQENFGISVAEALSCGLPVLISNKVNIWREIQDGGGAIVDEDTLDGTRRLLETWFAMDDASRAQMRKSARDVFCSHFDVSIAAQSLLTALGANSGDGLR